MSNGPQLQDVLRFDPDWVKDPVPPWIRNFLDKAVLKELAIIQLEYQKSLLEMQAKVTERALGAIRQHKETGK
ncbi:MAG TPA: hypothetical protein VJV04_13965 [Nitrospiraceae bacterium]|nr:hypothetical protein [Nitrospiraceae bacterium]